MRLSWVLSAVALILSSTSVHAIHGGQYLYNLLNNAPKTRDPNLALYQRLYEATGYVGTLDGDPTTEQADKNGRKGLVFKAPTQSGCSAIHIQEPAYFISSAVCFADADGKLDPYRRYARVFVKGKPWTIDPVSIVLHEDFRRGPSDNDLVVFTLEPAEIAAFDQAHAPIPPVAATSWVTEGQRVIFLGYGVTKEDGTDFGYPVYKEFMQSYPDASDLQDSNGKLLLSPEEKLLTYVTHDGSKGVNCLGDSGGGAFVRMAGSSSTQLYLQSILVGKVGPTGDASQGCDAISKYAIGVDMRYYGEWVSRAIARIATNREASAKAKEHYAQIRSTFYGGAHYELWVDVPAEDVRRVEEKYSGVSAHELNKQLYLFMVAEKKRREARQGLLAYFNHKAAGLSGWTDATLPADPWYPTGSDWVRFPKVAGNGDYRFLHSKFPEMLTQVTIRNIGKAVVEIPSYEMWTQNDSTPVRRKTPYVLVPGAAVDIKFVEVGTFDVLKLNGLQKDAEVLVHGVLANQRQVDLLNWKQEQARIAEQRKRDQEAAEAAERQRRWNNDEYNRLVREYNAAVQRREAAADEADYLYRTGQWSVSRFNRSVDEHNRAIRNAEAQWERDMRRLGRQ